MCFFAFIITVCGFGLHPECRGFESLAAHQLFTVINPRKAQCLRGFLVYTACLSLSCSSVVRCVFRRYDCRNIAETFGRIAETWHPHPHPATRHRDQNRACSTDAHGTIDTLSPAGRALFFRQRDAVQPPPRPAGGVPGRPIFSLKGCTPSLSCRFFHFLTAK